MRKPYGEAVATQAGSGPCRCGGDAASEAWAGERAGRALSRESIYGPGRRGCALEPKAAPRASLARDVRGPRAVEDPMHARKHSAQELGGPATGRDEDGDAVRAVNPTGARRR
jgi:hypothetical protein